MCSGTLCVAIKISMGHSRTKKLAQTVCDFFSKEYAELEWPIDIMIAIVWVIFGINMFGTILKRRERHLYVAIWFYIATVVTVAVLHIVNSLALPVH